MEQNTLAWSNEFDEQTNCTNLYAHIIDETGKSLLKVFIDQYNGESADNKSQYLFISYVEKMQLLAHILSYVKGLYDDTDMLDECYVEDREYADASALKDIQAFTTAIQDTVLKFQGFDISIYNVIIDNLGNDEFKENLNKFEENK